MPQIGWFEILIIVVIAILVIGPKDFPIVIKKIGNWVGSLKKYFNDVQEGFTDIESTVEEEISSKKELSNHKNKKNKNE
tara:strand:- start:418 stop:654 length:237 start_codon:yes stop_codon:yes gene_type:complete